MLKLVLIALAEEDIQRAHLSHQEQASRESEKETARAGIHLHGHVCTCACDSHVDVVHAHVASHPSRSVALSI